MWTMLGGSAVFFAAASTLLASTTARDPTLAPQLAAVVFGIGACVGYPYVLSKTPPRHLIHYVTYIPFSNRWGLFATLGTRTSNYAGMPSNYADVHA